MPAVLFGSISTIADTSELQREAFNHAFEAHGLGWSWDREEYRSLLQRSGGKDRIAEYAKETGDAVDAAAIHRTKSERFQQRLAESPPALRPGVAETMREAKDNGFKVAFVTTTAGANVASLLDGQPEISREDFDLIVDASSVEQPKPDAAAYAFALDALGETPESCVAIEDNLGGVEAAAATGVPCIAFPNENTAGHDFAKAVRRVERLSFSDVRASGNGSDGPR